MAGPFFIDDAGDPVDPGTNPGLNWAEAYPDFAALDAAKALASNEIVYIGHNSVDAGAGGNQSVVIPDVDPPLIVISATQGSDPVAYQKSATDQISSADGAYYIVLDGAAAFYGVQINSGASISFKCDGNETILLYDCTVKPANGSFVAFGYGGKVVMVGGSIDLVNDTGATSGVVIYGASNSVLEMINVTFANASNRTTTVFCGDDNTGTVFISGCDFSGFTNATLCELFRDDRLLLPTVVTNCITAATWAPLDAYDLLDACARLTVTNTGPADDPTYLIDATMQGAVISYADIYRTGGADIEGVACSWLCTTKAYAVEGNPYKTPWIYKTIDSTGLKTFTLYITNDTADFTDAEVWLEIEYLGTDNEAQWSLASDHRTTILTTAAAQTDDAASEWIGLNNAGQGLADYMQSLAVPATIGETGQYRARVCVGKANISSASYFYIDPKITVS